MRYWWILALPALAPCVPARAQVAAETVTLVPVLPPVTAVEPPRQPPSGYLGLVLAEVGPEAARLAGIPAGTGASVEDVVPGGPAAAAGLLAGDVLLALDGKPVGLPAQLGSDVRALAPGRKITLSFARGGRRQDVALAVGELPPPPPKPRPVGRVGPVFVVEGIRNPAAPVAEKLITLDVQAAGLGDAILRVLNGTGFPFRIAPKLLDDAALAAKPFGHKATNTPLSQVLDAVAAHYGIRWSMEGDVVVFEGR